MPFRHGDNITEKVDFDNANVYKQVIQFVIVKSFKLDKLNLIQRLKYFYNRVQSEISTIYWPFGVHTQHCRLCFSAWPANI